MTRWEAEALLQIRDDADFLLLNCTNTRFRRRAFKHGFYYLLNLIALKPPQTRPTPVPDQLDIVDRLDFESDWEGAWQRLPPEVLERLDDWRPDVAIKFGMGLMRVPPELCCKVLSFHHGDPRRYRGRPAGFYELLEGTPLLGQMVQVISNRLDGGEVVAFAETRVRPDTYRGTMADAYRTSPLLMPTAVRNAVDGTSLPIEPNGRNYRLPSNAIVVKVALKLFAAKAKRLTYGAFFYKAWEVACAEVKALGPGDLMAALGHKSDWNVIRRPSKYQFLADPFPHPISGVLVEALRTSDGQGEIVHFDGVNAHTLCSGAGHFSYPATVEQDGEWYVLPEVSEWTSPLVYRLGADAAEMIGELDVEGSPRIADATFYARNGLIFLFGNNVDDGSGVLRLWTARSLFHRFSEHPASPIRISPAGARMGGALLDIGGRTYRLGQDGSRGYGKGIVLFEVTELSANAYRELPAGELSFSEVSGPHTFNHRGDLAVFDFYRERFSLLAGFHRVRAHLAKRKVAAAISRESTG